MKSALLKVLALASLAIFTSSTIANGQTVNRDDILYLMPSWGGFQAASDPVLDAEIIQLRNRLGPEGPAW